MKGGGAHQSIGSPLIGMTQDGLLSFEPAYADELAAITEWSFGHLQRDKYEHRNEQDEPVEDAGGSVYLRLSTRSLEQTVDQIR